MRLPLSAVEVRKLWGATTGKDYMMWRVMILTGARIGEALSVDRADLVSEGLRIDESALNGQANYTKNKKIRIAPIPASLRAEVEEWLATHSHRLMFPTNDGAMHPPQRWALGSNGKASPQCDQNPGFDLSDVPHHSRHSVRGRHCGRAGVTGAEFTLRHYRKSVTARHPAAVEELDRKLKVVPIKTGAA